jgi:uncharacterized integral membrane protein
MKPSQWVAMVVLSVGAAVFASLNLAERITLNLGVVTFYRVPLPWIVFGAFLLGMFTMFALGLEHDRKVRRLLEEHERRRARESSDRYTVPM